MIKSILVTAYKDTQGFFNISGAARRLSCNQVFECIEYVNTTGEIVPMPQTSVPPLSGETTTDYDAKLVGVPQAGNYASPILFGDTTYKKCARVKDMENLVTTWFDYDNYWANIVQCNVVPYPLGCATVTNLSAGTPAATTATITWTGVASATGYEWVNNQSSTAPTGDGQFTEATTQALTGLTAATTYHFWIRTICGQGTPGESSWVSLSYTTHA